MGSREPLRPHRHPATASGAIVRLARSSHPSYRDVRNTWPVGAIAPCWAPHEVGTSAQEVPMTDKTQRATTPFQGTILRPSDPSYDEARTVFNAIVDRRPERIMRCHSADDVAAALAAARLEGLQVSVYGGGHGVTGSAVVDGGVCIDLRGLDDIEVDPAARTVRVGGGATWGARRRRHPGARTGRHRRSCHQHRRRRPRPRLRQRLAGALLRLHLRQPGLGAGGDGGRVASSRPPRTSTLTCSGRCAEVAATSASSPSSPSGCTRSARSSSAGC